MAEGLEVVGEFSDEAASAFTGNRGEGLPRAKEAAIAHGAELWVQHSDRLARGDGISADHLAEVWFALRRAGVRIRSVQDDHNLEDALRVVLIGERNNEDSKRKATAVKGGLRRRAAERGKLVGGPRPYGFRWVPELVDGKKVSHLEVVPVEAEVVVRIFEATVSGVSQRALCRSLNADSIPSATGKSWGPASVGRLLMNPLHMGMVRHNDEVFPGVHEAIVSEELWNSAAAIRSSAARRKGGRWPKGSHLFVKGLLRCACGAAMTPRTDPHRRGGLYQVYQCSGRLTHGLDRCDQRPIDRAVIDEAMLGELNRRYLDLDATREQLAARHAADSHIASEAKAQAQAEALRADERIARVQRAFQDGHLEPEDYADQRVTLLDEREAAMAAVERAQDHADTLEAAGALRDADEAVLRHMAALRQAIVQGISDAPDLNSLRTIIRQLFQAVLLLPSGDIDTAEVAAAEVGDYVLVPILRDDVIIARDGPGATAIQRAVLPLESANDGLQR